MKSSSHSTAERRLRSCLHLGPATGAARGCCCARAVRHPQHPQSSGAPSSRDGTPRENTERVGRHWRDNCTGKGAEVLSGQCLRKQHSHLTRLQRRARGFCSVTCVKRSVPGMNVVRSSALKQGGGAMFYFQPLLVPCVGNTAGTGISFCWGFALCCR